MSRRWLVIIAALMFWPSAVSAHDVPDRVKIDVFVKPENDHLLILVRMPANALIDFLLPTLPDGNWVDLANADSVAAAGANVWIADMLSLYEGGTALARPHVLAVRISRVNDPSFSTFQDALTRVHGSPLPIDTLVLQDQVTVDALLQTPVNSVDSSFSFEPRFARLGVVVDTSVTFLPPAGGIRQFRYQDDPEAFELDPGRGRAIRRFLNAGFAHYFGQTDYLLLALCVALVFPRPRLLLPFVVALGCAESLVLIAALELMPSLPWLRVVGGVLIAATIVYTGIEAIIAGNGRRVGLAIGVGLVLGCGFWFGLQPLLQFGGTHALASSLAFNIGVVTAELATMALLVAAVQMVLRLSRAPRAAVTIAAAIAIHIAWRRMLDRADALALVQVQAPAVSPAQLAVIGAVAIAALAGSAHVLRRRDQGTAVGSATPTL
jgi:HupE / UreJ protein